MASNKAAGGVNAPGVDVGPQTTEVRADEIWGGLFQADAQHAVLTDVMQLGRQEPEPTDAAPDERCASPEMDCPATQGATGNHGQSARQIFEELLPELQGRATRKARRLVGTYGFLPADEEDISQGLLLALLERLDSFDPEKGDMLRFAAMVFNHRICSLIRDKFAEKRGEGRKKISLDAPIRGEDGDVRSMTETIPDPRDPTGKAAERHAELDDSLNRLSSRHRELVESLKTRTFAEIATERDCDRANLYRDMPAIKLALSRDYPERLRNHDTPLLKTA